MTPFNGSAVCSQHTNLTEIPHPSSMNALDRSPPKSKSAQRVLPLLLALPSACSVSKFTCSSPSADSMWPVTKAPSMCVAAAAAPNAAAAVLVVSKPVYMEVCSAAHNCLMPGLKTANPSKSMCITQLSQTANAPAGGHMQSAQ